MSVRRVHRWSVSIGLVSGAVAAVLGMGVAHADDGGAGTTDQIHGWTVIPTGDTSDLLPGATLSDPDDSLGLGTSPIAGGWESVAATPLSSIGSNDLFTTPLASLDSLNNVGVNGTPSGIPLFAVPLTSLDSPDSLEVNDIWMFGVDESMVNVGGQNSTLAFLVPAAGGSQVVDLFNITKGDAPPLFNPDAAGPIDVGGVELASPDAGALVNDLGDALFKGDTTAWTNATTLLDDLFGIDPSGAADAVDPGGLLPDLGF